MFEKNPPFKIQEAYFQKWSAGIKEGGRGARAYLIFETLEPGVEIKELYFRNKVQEIRKSLKNPNEYVASFSEPSTDGRVMDIDPLKEIANTPPRTIPFDIEAHEAVVRYTHNGTNHFYKVLHLSEKENIAYPRANPNGN